MYKLILFDVDGVFLSEERCFDASALSIWELLHSPNFLGLPKNEFTDQPTEEQIQHIRQQVFQQNRVLDWMKSKGMNSNWDMVYLVFSGQFMLLLKECFASNQQKVRSILEQPITDVVLREFGEWMRETHQSFTPSYDRFVELFQDHEQIDKHDLLTYFNQLAEQWFGISVNQFSRNSALWELGRSIYQEWYLGSDRYQKIEKQPILYSKKRGFLDQEIPLADPNQIRQMLRRLHERNITLGIGTGRPQLETEVPLQALGFYSFFDLKKVVSASDVIRAERLFPQKAPLGKPHPYTYLKGVWGKDADDQTVLSASLPISKGEEILIVGDSVADYLAAKQMGCRFAATLTGLTGQAARGKFEKLGADYILNNVTELDSIFADSAID